MSSVDLDQHFEACLVLADHPRRELLQKRAGDWLDTGGNFPNSRTRPLLFAAVLDQLGDKDDPDAGTASSIVDILSKPYAPFFAADVQTLMKDQERPFEALAAHPTVNATVRNTLIADQLRDFVAEAGWTPVLRYANYTWRELAASRDNQGIPEDMPDGTADRRYLKLMVEFQRPDGRAYLADYGQRTAGEGFGRVQGTPLPYTEPVSVEGFFSVLREIANSQARPSDREAVESMVSYQDLLRGLRRR